MPKILDDSQSLNILAEMDQPTLNVLIRCEVHNFAKRATKIFPIENMISTREIKDFTDSTG
jgi:hypothetical protein